MRGLIDQMRERLQQYSCHDVKLPTTSANGLFLGDLEWRSFAKGFLLHGTWTIIADLGYLPIQIHGGALRRIPFSSDLLQLLFIPSAFKITLS